jgi:hypothetical protein
MTELIDKRLVDEAMDAYIDWREECAAVWAAAERWAGASVGDGPLVAAAYGAALDREERASEVYADVMNLVAAASRRSSEPIGAGR